MKKGLKGQETRNKLLSIAASEFAARGFNDTKVDVIVRTANLTKPSFYLYFSSKQAIFDELVSECTIKLKNEVRKVRATHIDEKISRRERVAEALENLFRFIFENKEIMTIALVLNGKSDEIVKELTDLVKENLEVEASINYIKPIFTDSIFADILVTNALMLCKNYLITGKSSPKEIALVLSSLLNESIFYIGIFLLLPNHTFLSPLLSGKGDRKRKERPLAS